MSLYLIGKDYKNALLEEREALLRASAKIAVHFPQGKILATCNRFEIYGTGMIPDNLPILLKGARVVSDTKLIFRHALRVAVGLESQIKGETQISEQLSVWLKIGNLPPRISALWSKAFEEAQGIRKISGLLDARQNIAAAIFAMLKKQNRRIKIIVNGTGKVAQLFSHYKPEWADIDFVAHKNFARAQYLAQRVGGRALRFEDLSYALASADVLIGASASPHIVFKHAPFKNILGDRIGPLFAFDLAFPRDIDPELKGAKNLILYDLDNLSQPIAEFNARIARHLALAEYLIDEKVSEYARDQENIEVGNAA
jgi:glutamyl-tRNA reductase